MYITYTDIYYRQRQDILDILNAPEIGLLFIIRSHLILLTGHCRPTTTTAITTIQSYMNE